MNITFAYPVFYVKLFQVGLSPTKREHLATTGADFLQARRLSRCPSNNAKALNGIQSTILIQGKLPTGSSLPNKPTDF